MWKLHIIYPTSRKTTQSITAAGWDIFTAFVRTKEKSCPSQMVKAWPTSGETSGDTISRYLRANPLLVLSWQQEAHLGPPVQTQPTWSPRDRLVEHSPEDHTTHLAFEPAWASTPSQPALGLFSTSHSQPPQMPWWESQGGPPPFSQNNVSQRPRPERWSLQAILQKFQISWHWPTKTIIKGKQPSFSFY